MKLNEVKAAPFTLKALVSHLEKEMVGIDNVEATDSLATFTASDSSHTMNVTITKEGGKLVMNWQSRKKKDSRVFNYKNRTVTDVSNNIEDEIDHVFHNWSSY